MPRRWLEEIRLDVTAIAFCMDMNAILGGNPSIGAERGMGNGFTACLPGFFLQIPHAMPKLAIIFGIVLDALGVAAFIAAGATHLPALIPSLFGMMIFFCGILAHVRPDRKKHAMHVAAMFGLFGTLAGLGMGLGAVLSGPVQRPVAAVLQFSIGLTALAFLALCVKSFIDARRDATENDVS